MNLSVPQHRKFVHRARWFVLKRVYINFDRGYWSKCSVFKWCKLVSCNSVFLLDSLDFRKPKLFVEVLPLKIESGACRDACTGLKCLATYTWRKIWKLKFRLSSKYSPRYFALRWNVRADKSSNCNYCRAGARKEPFKIFTCTINANQSYLWFNNISVGIVKPI